MSGHHHGENDHHTDHHHDHHDEHDHQVSSFHAFLRGIILFGFTLLFLSLFINGTISYYIAPKMMPFMYFAFGVLLILSVLQIIRSTSKNEEQDCGCEGHDHIPNKAWKTVLIYSIFIFPLVAGFVIPDRALDSSVADRRGVQLTGDVTTNQLINAEQLSLEEALARSEGKTAEDYLAEIDARGTGGEDEINHLTYDELYEMAGGFDEFYMGILDDAYQGDVITVTDDNFLDMMTVFDLYLDDLIGEEVEIMGFVYREKSMRVNQLVVARFSMTCCTADSQVFGMLVEGEETRQFDRDQWVQVRGVLESTTYVYKEESGDDEEPYEIEFILPVLNIKEIYEVDAPDTPYVYPNFNF